MHWGHVTKLLPFQKNMRRSGTERKCKKPLEQVGEKGPTAGGSWRGALSPCWDVPLRAAGLGPGISWPSNASKAKGTMLGLRGLLVDAGPAQLSQGEGPLESLSPAPGLSSLSSAITLEPASVCHLTATRGVS